MLKTCYLCTVYACPPSIFDPEVFEPFFRLDESRNRHLGGVGLGLSMVQKIIQNHQGTISISDSPLGGARLIFQLPVFKLELR